ncbi:hypothetical protein [Virgibacillus salexigens]|uniref:hypothetical protein n=1 Tax=Virgibacillus salexigens TaxID=61016 RepID=UPI00190993B4|nr:hypothetical protein [Virgibacillus salexigens]
MNKRDLQIIKDLERFRVMSRDDIIELYFSRLKNPVTCANTVLKRLVRDKQIGVSKSFTPYVYFPIQSTIKHNSTKIPHFLQLVEVYKQIRKYTTPKTFQIEPKYKKGLAEPDIFTTIKGAPFFIEVQRNLYSQKVMNEKIKRYEALKISNEFKPFPFIVMITSTNYEIQEGDLTVFQVGSIQEFMQNISKKKEKVKEESNGIKFKIG